MADIIYVPKTGYDANDYNTGAIKSVDTPGTIVDFVDEAEYVALARTTINGADTYTQPAAAASGLAVSFIDEYVVPHSSSTNDGKTYTFTGCDIGAAAVDRELYIIVQYSGGPRLANTTETPKGVIVTPDVGAPVSVTNIVDDVVRNGSSTVNTFVQRVLVPTGTSASIEINNNSTLSTIASVRISIYHVTGRTAQVNGLFNGVGNANVTDVAVWDATNDAGTTTTSGTSYFNVEIGDVILGVGSETGDPGDVSITGVTSEGTLLTEASNRTFRCGSTLIAAADTDYVVTVSGGSSRSASFVQLR